MFLQCCFSQTHTFRAHLPHSLAIYMRGFGGMAPLGTVWEGVTALRSCRCTASLRVCPLAVEGWAGKVTCRCVQFTEHAQLVHLVNPGLLRTSLALPHNNKDTVVFSTLLSASFAKVSNYFLYLGSSSLSQEACFYVISKFCSLHGRSQQVERRGPVDCKENPEGNFRWAQPCPSLPYLDS